ncbi:tetratricopeptide repeat-containing sulfotransferase family protein [Pseudidiomarina salilacus]|uniref:tetratricopeptide repeat-containing sulfotransferase family protein n=1 Tax=Pseudidiomarina salilacus TaxID=3384452 RepID=UPI003984A6B8
MTPEHHSLPQFSQLPQLDQAAQQAWQQGRARYAVDLYLANLHQFERYPGAWYNCAFYLRHAGDFQLAIEHYQRALKLGIDSPEEVWLNIGVIHNEGLLDNQAALAAFEQALALRPNYLPALLNLGNCHEQQGDRSAAAACFRKVIELEPINGYAFARLADVTQFDASADPLISAMQQLLAQANLPHDDHVDLLFALGKAHDDCAEYATAFSFYQQANKLNAQRMPAWQAEQQQAFARAQTAWLEVEPTANSVGAQGIPVFICGMFRSGSTLLEQMLGAHSEVSTGGELDFFARFDPARRGQAATNALARQLGADYLNFVSERLPAQRYFTDKRPDNIWRMGLIKRALPEAKFIVTKRHPLDNALSVYFTRLGAGMNYANSISDTLAFIAQQEQLLTEWQQDFGADIYTIDYEQVVQQPEQQLRALLEWLDLPWQAACLDFHQRRNSVRTASVWQVRQPLYTRSIQRYKNYAEFLPPWPEPKQ